MQREFISFDQAELHALRLKRRKRERALNIAWGAFFILSVCAVVSTTYYMMEIVK